MTDPLAPGPAGAPDATPPRPTTFPPPGLQAHAAGPSDAPPMAFGGTLRATDHLMPASIGLGAPKPNRRRDRRDRRSRQRSDRSNRRSLVALALGLTIAAWIAGLLGALAGSEIADRRAQPPRRPSTLGIAVAAPRTDEPGPIDVAAVADVIWFSTNRKKFKLQWTHTRAIVEDKTFLTTPPDFKHRPHHAYRITIS